MCVFRYISIGVFIFFKKRYTKIKSKITQVSGKKIFRNLIFAFDIMKTKNEILRSFSTCDKDFLRLEEKKHEAKLKKQLSDLGIEIEFDKIAHYGINGV